MRILHKGYYQTTLHAKSEVPFLRLGTFCLNFYWRQSHYSFRGKRHYEQPFNPWPSKICSMPLSDVFFFFFFLSFLLFAFFFFRCMKCQDLCSSNNNNKQCFKMSSAQCSDWRLKGFMHKDTFDPPPPPRFDPYIWFNVACLLGFSKHAKFK